MLVDLKTILADTREKHYAVGLFNCVTLEMTKGILAAAEELHSPVIIGPAESLLPGASLAEYADMMLGMARRAGVPVALHFARAGTPAAQGEPRTASGRILHCQKLFVIPAAQGDSRRPASGQVSHC